MKNKTFIVTYINSGTIVLSRSCSQSCLYCNFSRKDDDLISLLELENLIANYSRHNINEVVFVAGQSCYEFPQVQLSLANFGCQSFSSYLQKVCEISLKHNIIPTLQIGYLSPLTLKSIADWVGSVRIPLPLADLSNEDEAHCNAKIRNYLSAVEMIQNAHNYNVPYSLDIIIGIGETFQDRIETTKKIAQFCGVDPWLQDIRVITFQPQPNTKFYSRPPLQFDQVASYFELLAKEFPVHYRSVQVNLFSSFITLTNSGLNDLGFCNFLDNDPIMPNFPTPTIFEISSELEKRNGYLLERISLVTPAAINRPHIVQIYNNINAKIKSNLVKTPYFYDNNKCFVCGTNNPESLNIKFNKIDEITAIAYWVTSPKFQGYAGILHGGIVATLLDEAMAYALMNERSKFVTVELKVKFIKPVPVGVPVTIIGKKISSKHKLYNTKAFISLYEGEILAEAEAKFVEISNK